MKVIFPIKRVSEAVNLAFDFTSQLGVGETISTASMSTDVYTGGETVPSLTLGTPSISGNVVTSLAGAGLLGTIYGVTCQITTSLGQTLRQWGYLTLAPSEI